MSIIRPTFQCLYQNLPYIIGGSIAITAFVIGALAMSKTAPFASFPYTDDLSGIAFTVAVFAILSCMVCGSSKRKRPSAIQQPAASETKTVKNSKQADLEFIKQELEISSIVDQIRGCPTIPFKEHECGSEEVKNEMKSTSKGTRYLDCKDGSILILSCTKVANLEMLPLTICFMSQGDLLKIVSGSTDYNTDDIKKESESPILLRFKKLLKKGSCKEENVTYNLNVQGE